MAHRSARARRGILTGDSSGDPVIHGHLSRAEAMYSFHPQQCPGRIHGWCDAA